MKQGAIYFLIFLGGFFFFNTPVHAQEKSTYALSLEPAYQEVEIPEDAEIVETSITLKNDSDTLQQVEFFAFDFQQTDHFGSIGLLAGLTENYPHTLASFVTFETDTTVIEPHSEQTVTIRIENRASLSPGGHYAALITRLIQEDATSEQKIVPAISSLLLVRKHGGDQVHLSLKNVDWQTSWLTTTIPKKITATFENQGNIHVIPRGTVTVTDFFGTVVYQGTINESSSYVLPGTIREIPIELKKSAPLLPIMFVSVSIEGYSNLERIPFAAEQSFLYINTTLLFTLILLGTGSIYLYRRKKSQT